VSQDFEAFHPHRGSPGPEETLDPLVMSEDGKGIVMRKEDLREATERAAERDGHKLKTRLSQGEKRDRKRMATMATVYSIERLLGVEGQQEEEAPKRERATNGYGRVSAHARTGDRGGVSGGAARDPEGSGRG
jgi:hypothetical protein